MTTRKALGRGLDALIPPKREEAKEAGDFEKIENVPVDQIVASRYQPRVVFNEEAIKELADSIKEKGVIQPVILAKKQNGYELVAGERRWRAVKSLGQKTIPAIIK
ncbi:Chromosome (plasmid) partitioning protein ParB, partial [hydrothermal vent metagenome]